MVASGPAHGGGGGWGAHSINKLCPEPSDDASRLGVGKSSGELAGRVHCWQLGSGCLCSAASYGWLCGFDDSQGRKKHLPAPLFLEKHPRHVLKSVETDFPPIEESCFYVTSTQSL